MEWQVVSVQPLEKGRVKFRFDDELEVILYKGEARKLALTEGCIVSEETYNVIMHEILGMRAKKRAMHLLERQERTERQLYDKLKQNGYPEVCIAEAIAYVKHYHYVDDFRYAATYIRYHQEKKSRQRLQMDLLGKGVPKAVIEEAFEEEYYSDECKKIRELLLKRHYDCENADRNEQRKQYQFLLRRGFHSSDILKVMKGADFTEV